MCAITVLCPAQRLVSCFRVLCPAQRLVSCFRVLCPAQRLVPCSASCVLLSFLCPPTKLADIEQDMCRKAANILCFCETWLTASQASPNIPNNQVASRCDRQTGDNKGGAMIYSQMQTCHARSFTSPGIEVACSTVTLPNGNHMQILVLYRSPNVQLQALTVLLSRLLQYVSTTNMPSVILGDFNHDILS